MIVWNPLGLACSVGSALVAWLVGWVLDWGMPEGALLWAFLMGCCGCLVDRLPAGGALLCYRAIFAFRPLPPGARVALFGVPLIAAPLMSVVCAVVIPLIDDSPAPSRSFMIWSGVSCVASLVLVRLTRGIRMIPTLEVPDGLEPEVVALSKDGDAQHELMTSRRMPAATFGAGLAFLVMEHFANRMGSSYPILRLLMPLLVLLGAAGLVDPCILLSITKYSAGLPLPLWTKILGWSITILAGALGLFLMSVG